MDDDLGALLRRHRQDADLTIEDLAAASGVSDRGIGDIERGVSRGPQHRTVEALADALRLRPDDRAALLRLARDGRRRPAAAVPHGLPLPRRVADFTGRVQERAGLGSVLRGGGPDAPAPVAVVTGPPGFGKTTLAAQVARDLRDDFPERLFLDLRGVDHEPVTPDAAVRRVAEALASGTVPPDPDAASAHVRGLLTDRRVLLVLDNAASEEQVRPLVPADGPSAVLVTSRRALAGLDGVQHRTVLGRLAPGDSVGLLDAILPGRGSPEDLARLARLCDDVPLALRIAGNRLAARSGWSIDGLVRRMTADERRLDALTAGDLRVRAAFTSSYEQLGPGAQRLFRRLALVDAPTAGAGLAAALVGESVWRTEDLLDELVDLSLVQHLPGDRYGLHDLLRLYARSELEHQEDAAAHDAVRAAADDWLLRTTVRAGYRFEPDHAHEGSAAPGERDVDLPDQEAAQAWLRAESASWLSALRRAAAAGAYARVAEVADALHWFSDLWATWDRWAEVFDLSADAATALGDDRLIAVHEGYRAWAQSVCRGDLARARAAADRALAAARRCGDTTQEGWALSYRSWIASQSGDLAHAERDAAAAVDCMLAAGDHEGAPQAMLSLAKARQRLGRLDEAAATVRATIARVADPRTRPRAQVAPFTKANAHVYLASILVEAERWEEARSAASEALRLAAPLGVPRIVATAHLARGRAHAALGNTDAAVLDIEIAVAERRELGIDAPLAAAVAALAEVRAAAVGAPATGHGAADRAPGCAPDRAPQPTVAG